MDHDFQTLNLVSNIEGKYERLRIKAIASSTIASLAVTYVIIFDGLTYGKPYLNVIIVGDFIAYWMPILCTSFMVLQFCTFVALLKERFTWLNLQLKKIAFLSAKHASIKRNLKHNTQNLYFISQ